MSSTKPHDAISISKSMNYRPIRLELLASVLSPRGVRRLCFSLGIQELVPAVPRNSLCPAPAPYTPVAARPVIRLSAG